MHKNKNKKDTSPSKAHAIPGFEVNPSKPENQNQQHNTKKEALGPNTER